MSFAFALTLINVSLAFAHASSTSPIVALALTISSLMSPRMASTSPRVQTPQWSCGPNLGGPGEMDMAMFLKLKFTRAATFGIHNNTPMPEHLPKQIWSTNVERISLQNHNLLKQLEKRTSNHNNVHQIAMHAHKCSFKRTHCWRMIVWKIRQVPRNCHGTIIATKSVEKKCFMVPRLNASLPLTNHQPFKRATTKVPHFIKLCEVQKMQHHHHVTHTTASMQQPPSILRSILLPCREDIHFSLNSAHTSENSQALPGNKNLKKKHWPRQRKQNKTLQPKPTTKTSRTKRPWEIWI